MKVDRVLSVLVAVILVAAAAVFMVKSRGLSDARVPEVVARSESVSLLMIGIEGLDLSIVERMRAEGRLPELDELISEGALGAFASLGRGVDPKISWTSIVTGVTPERQGVGGTTTSPRGRTVDAPLVPSSRTVGTLWTALSESRPPVAVFGWMGTWPVERIDGVMVAPYTDYVLEREHGGTIADVVHPLALWTVVDPLIEPRDSYSRKDLARFVDLDTRLGLEALIGKGYEDLREAVAGDRSMTALARRQSSEPGAWTMFVFLGGVETVSERFWHMANPGELRWGDLTAEATDLVAGQCEALGATIERYYEFADELVGDLVELVARDGTVVVVSDHGYDGLRYDDRGHPMIGSHLHGERGFWIIRGPGVQRGARADDGDLLDVAPTVAASIGLEIGHAPDGRVHDEVLTPGAGRRGDAHAPRNRGWVETP